MADQQPRWTSAPGVDLSDSALDTFTRLCVKNSEYHFVHGGHGKNYVDVDQIFGVPPQLDNDLTELLDAAVSTILRLRDAESYDLLAFVDTGRGPVGIVAAHLLLSQRTGLQSVTVRSDRRVLSQAVKPFRPMRKSRALILTDVATSGKSIGDAAGILWRLGALNCGALAFADRLEGADIYLQNLGIDLHAVVLPPDLSIAA